QVTALVAEPSGNLSLVGSFALSDVVVARLAAPDLRLAWRRDGGAFPAVPGPFLPRAAAPGDPSWLVGAGQNTTIPAGVFSVLSFDATGRLHECGDDIVDPGETCDDGTVQGDDCCTSDCSATAPESTPCSDGSLCTTNDYCSVGRCQSGAP